MHRILVLLALLGLAACATATPYGPATREGGYGFSEQQIEEDRFRVTFRGNSSTARETVENALLYRAAELTVQRGYDYFLVEENDTETRRSYSTTGGAFGGPGFGGPGFGGRGFYGPAFYGRYGYGYPFYRRRYAFPYYAYGFGWGAPYYDSYTREITRYSAVAFIVMRRGEKPEDDPRAFDAEEVLRNLGPVVLGPPAP